MHKYCIYRYHFRRFRGIGIVNSLLISKFEFTNISIKNSGNVDMI